MHLKKKKLLVASKLNIVTKIHNINFKTVSLKKTHRLIRLWHNENKQTINIIQSKFCAVKIVFSTNLNGLLGNKWMQFPLWTLGVSVKPFCSSEQTGYICALSTLRHNVSVSATAQTGALGTPGDRQVRKLTREPQTWWKKQNKTMSSWPREICEHLTQRKSSRRSSGAALWEGGPPVTEWGESVLLSAVYICMFSVQLLSVCRRLKSRWNLSCSRKRNLHVRLSSRNYCVVGSGFQVRR